MEFQNWAIIVLKLSILKIYNSIFVTLILKDTLIFLEETIIHSYKNGIINI